MAAPVKPFVPPALDVQLPDFASAADVLTSSQSLLRTIKGLLTNLEPGGVTETFLEALALNLGDDASTYPGVTSPGAYEFLKQVRDGAFILLASGPSLDAKAADVGVFRKPPTASTIQVIFISDSGPLSSGKTIPAGTLISAPNPDPTQPPIVFSTDNTITMAIGDTESAPDQATCTQTGSFGIVFPGPLTVISGVSGLSAYSATGSSGGTDLEGDDAPLGGLRARALAAIANSGQSTVTALYWAALSYPGITSAKVLENTLTDGQTFQAGAVTIFVDDGSGNLGNALNPNNPSVVQFQHDLDNGAFRAAGTFPVTILGSLISDIHLSIAIGYSVDYVATKVPLATLLSTIQALVLAYINSLPCGAPVLIADIIELVGVVPGVSNVFNVLIFGQPNDFFPPSGQYVPRVSNISNIVLGAVGVTY